MFVAEEAELEELNLQLCPHPQGRPATRRPPLGEEGTKGEEQGNGAQGNDPVSQSSAKREI